MSPRTLLLALSGPSSSGKTTLARLLRDALAPHAFILHEDDFYKTDAEIPVVTVADGRQLQDWDCLESVDVQGLRDMLLYVKEHGKIKEGFESKEDKNAVGNVNIHTKDIERWRTTFEDILDGKEVRIAIIDGFLLYPENVAELREIFDIKILLHADYQTVKRRREARKGYVTLEGFWEDPEGYVDLIVWPNYVRDHSPLFENNSVDGAVKAAVVSGLGIDVMPKDAMENMGACFEWACGILRKSLERTSSG